MKLTLSLVAVASASTVAMAASQFKGLAYNPKQLKTGQCPTVDTVRDDLKMLEQYTNQVRIYSVKDCNQGEPVLRAMQGTDWKVQLGLWVSDVEQVYQADKTELLRLAGIFDFKTQVSSVIVGNEAIYRKEQTQAQIADKVTDVKNALSKIGLGDIPVTTSETWPYYDATLINAVDYVNMHAFPFWEGTSIDGAQTKVFQHIYDMQKLAGNKKVVVGETGWPDAGGNYDQAVPSLQNEHRYLQEFICRASLENIDYVWFSAFDEAWKPTTNASDVETHWGIIKGDKTPKFASPMYNCKGFVPSSKIGDSESSSAGDSSDADNGEGISDIEEEQSDLDSDASESSNESHYTSKHNSNESKSSDALPLTAHGYSAVGIAFSAIALVTTSFF
ncbi:glycoside hydrolase 3 protein [Coemansia spiralis]|uniref:glucan endo-1,3-beta-D-glucosidase n=2 Tax=Coemansia TaxID=4863 RepID=A0A9W8G5Z4_9FUNG|nr:glycoside hydrolase 3 protein [Coemansia umbellata]KAJ2622944.1 glycoside hydrolase 3 protein [Coemansia sp. RSA 1358]KAJ2679445.1 glycoside hydrolase 3 protein [Coemansia spiralis]